MDNRGGGGLLSITFQTDSIMASINVAQADFDAVAGAAWDAKFRKDEKASAALDKVARKINCALSSAGWSAIGGPVAKRLTWRDVPSVFDTSVPKSLTDAP